MDRRSQHSALPTDDAHLPLFGGLKPAPCDVVLFPCLRGRVYGPWPQGHVTQKFSGTNPSDVSLVRDLSKITNSCLAYSAFISVAERLSSNEIASYDV